jgi:hypothetical protein
MVITSCRGKALRQGFDSRSGAGVPRLENTALADGRAVPTSEQLPFTL